MVDQRFALAVDIGATKAALAIVTGDFQVAAKTEVHTGASGHIWDDMVIAAHALLDGASGDLVGVGIATAGPIDLPQGTISPVNIPSWTDFPIVQHLAALTGSSRVALHGDAIALANAEHQLGAGRGARNMLGMVVSTGIGGGLVIDDKLVTGSTGNAGFFGHHSINERGRVCACGRVGCLEAYASGPAMVSIARELGWQGVGDSFQDLAESARVGDAIAVHSIELGAHSLAVGIVNVFAIVDLHVVVVGGGVSQAGDIYWTPLRRALEAEASFAGFLAPVDVRLAQLERDAGLLGAALAIMGADA